MSDKTASVEALDITRLSVQQPGERRLGGIWDTAPAKGINPSGEGLVPSVLTRSPLSSSPLSACPQPRKEQSFRSACAKENACDNKIQ